MLPIMTLCDIDITGSLTISGGVTVRFENNTSMEIYGTLNANGAAGNNVTFTRNDADDEWRYLWYRDGSNGSLSYATIEYATYSTTGRGVYAATGSTVSLDHSILRYNDIGLYAYGSNPTLINNCIYNNQYGIYLENASIPIFGTSAGEWND